MTSNPIEYFHANNIIPHKYQVGQRIVYHGNIGIIERAYVAEEDDYNVLFNAYVAKMNGDTWTGIAECDIILVDTPDSIFKELLK